MAKRNTSGSSSGRRGSSRGNTSGRSSGRNESSGERSSYKKTGKSGPRSSEGGERGAFGKKSGSSFSDRRKTDRPFNKPFNKSGESSGESSFENKRSGSFSDEKRPYKSAGPRAGKSFPKRDEGSESKSSYRGKSSRPFSKDSGRGERKSYPKREDGNFEDKRGTYKGKSSRPFSKDSGKRSFDKDSERGERKPYQKREGGNFEDRKRSPSSFRDKPARSFDKDSERRSFGKSDSEGGERKSHQKREGSGEKRSSSSYKGRTTRPFDKDSEKRSFDKSGPGREERKPFSKRSDSFEDKRPSSQEEKDFSKDSESQRKSFSKTGGKKPRIKTEGESDNSGKIRLNRYIANSGICSRREADDLISMGLISVNGKTITELGYKVNPTDEVRYESKVLKAEKPVYILMNKPKGFLTTTDDPQERNTVMHIIGSSVKERIYPVGRLDRNTTGLLLLTNDGDLADKLMHPSYNAKKIYKVELDKPLTKGDLKKVAEGVMLEEGRAIVDDVAIVTADGKTVGVEIHIGWNRVVRRIFESLGYAIVKLDRSVYAGLDKKELSRGQWRYLKNEEIVRLKHYK
jgi:23S rRNA pseudouridine2605 synthase